MVKRGAAARNAVTTKSKERAGDQHPALRLAFRLPIRVFDEDIGEVITLTPGQTDPGSIEGVLIDFRYTSAEGEMTRRLLLCWECGRDNERIYVRGYCPFREDLRTFRVDRMRDVIEIRADRQLPVEDPLQYFSAFAAREPG